jgi:hypothetical protein
MDKTKYMVMPHHQNGGQNHNSLTSNKAFENVAKFKYFGTTVRNLNCIQREIKGRLNSGNPCYHSALSLLSSRLLPKNFFFFFLIFLTPSFEASDFSFLLMDPLDIW